MKDSAASCLPWWLLPRARVSPPVSTSLRHQTPPRSLRPPGTWTAHRYLALPRAVAALFLVISKIIRRAGVSQMLSRPVFLTWPHFRSPGGAGETYQRAPPSPPSLKSLGSDVFWNLEFQILEHTYPKSGTGPVTQQFSTVTPAAHSPGHDSCLLGR